MSSTSPIDRVHGKSEFFTTFEIFDKKDIFEKNHILSVKYYTWKYDCFIECTSIPLDCIMLASFYWPFEEAGIDKSDITISTSQ